jgi:propionyl-CoA synthetase
VTLWGNDQGFYDKYLADTPGFYNSGDAGFMNEKGYIHILSRTDDIINTAGHRLATGRVEEAISFHPEVAECAVVGFNHEIKGEVPLAFIVLKG